MEFKTLYGKYLGNNYLLVGNSYQLVSFYSNLQDEQYVGKFIYVGGRIMNDTLIVHEVVEKG